MTTPAFPFPELEVEIGRVLADAPIVFCEIGARRGGKRFRALGRHVRYFGFEPDEKEAARLERDLAPFFRSVRVIRSAVMDTEGRILINVLRHGGCSSVLTPDRAVIDRYATRRADTATWPAFFDKVGTYACDATTLDKVARDEAMNYCDFLGMDTQGTESQILDASGQVLAKTSIVHIEMETVPLYTGQALLPELATRLAAARFRLLGLENHQAISRSPAGVDDLIDRGELVSVDGLFYRDAQEGASASEGGAAALIRRMLVLHEVGFRTLAIDIGRSAASAGDLSGRLAAAMTGRYHSDNAKAEPLRRRARRLVRRVLGPRRTAK